MLHNWFVLQLTNHYTKDSAWFQGNRSLAHYALAVREYLSKDFGNIRLAVGCQFWPVHLTGHLIAQTCQCVINYLWRFLKEVAAKQCYHTNEDLKQAVRLAFQSVSLQRLWKMSHRTQSKIILCHENGGAEKNSLDTKGLYHMLQNI